MRTTIQISALLALFSPLAQAEIDWTYAHRSLGVNVNNVATVNSNVGLGDRDNLLIRTGSNEFGATVAKISHESVMNPNLFKSTTFVSTNSVLGSPIDDHTGSGILSRLEFTLSHRTTFELSYWTIDESSLDDLFTMRIDDALENTLLSIEEHTQSAGRHIITLDAGNYLIYDQTELRHPGPDNFGDWHFASSYTLRIVPTPSTLAPLFAATLFATRRRRC